MCLTCRALPAAFPPFQAADHTVLLSDSARSHARALSAVATALSVVLALAVWLGMNDRSWTSAVPVIAALAATAWPTRVVVAIAMVASAAVVVQGINGSGVLFGATVVLLMLALNNLQAAATQIRRNLRRQHSSPR